jgi:hypothetical protein
LKHLAVSCLLVLLTFSAAFGMQPAAIATMKGLPSNVDCPAGQVTKLMSFTPGWTYIPGLNNIGTWVTANFQFENTSSVEATGVELWLGWGNRVAGPFTVKAGQDLFVSGMAADGFQPPTTYADYSPYVYVPENSAAGVTVINSGPGTSIIEFLHGF